MSRGRNYMPRPEEFSNEFTNPELRIVPKLWYQSLVDRFAAEQEKLQNLEPQLQAVVDEYQKLWAEYNGISAKLQQEGLSEIDKQVLLSQREELEAQLLPLRAKRETLWGQKEDIIAPAIERLNKEVESCKQIDALKAACPEMGEVFVSIFSVMEKLEELEKQNSRVETAEFQRAYLAPSVIFEKFQLNKQFFETYPNWISHFLSENQAPPPGDVEVINKFKADFMRGVRSFLGIQMAMRLARVIEDYCSNPKVQERDQTLLEVYRNGQQYVAAVNQMVNTFARAGIRFHNIRFLQPISTELAGRYKEYPSQPTIKEEWAIAGEFFENRDYDGQVADVVFWGYDMDFDKEDGSTSSAIWCWRRPYS